MFVFLIFTFMNISQNEVLGEEGNKWNGWEYSGREFLGCIFPGGVWWVGIFRVGIFLWVIFLEPIKPKTSRQNSQWYQNLIDKIATFCFDQVLKDDSIHKYSRWSLTLSLKACRKWKRITLFRQLLFVSLYYY